MDRALNVGRRSIVVALGALVVGGGAVALASTETRDEILLKLSPGAFRRHVLHRYRGADGEAVYLLGTIHGDHLTTPAYSLLAVQSAVLNLKPDLLLVESRPQALAAANWADGPIEMGVASLTAHAAGIAVLGMDWWTMDASHDVDSDAREAHMFANIAAALPGHRTALILTGFSHAPAFDTRLRAAGYALVAFPDAEKDHLFDAHGRTFVFPAGMTDAVKSRIAIDTQDLAGVNDPFWRARISDAIAARRKLLGTIAKVGEAPAAAGRAA